MIIFDFAKILFFLIVLCITTPLLGAYLYVVFKQNKKIPVLEGIEKGCYKIAGINSAEEMPVRNYLKALLFFNGLGFLFLIFLLLFQYYLPLNPQRFEGLSLDLAFNVASSFVTNTNWQSYSGETKLSYLSQMLGLGVQNFLSAASGFAVLLVLVRGLSGNKPQQGLGNFWVDITRFTVYVLLPLSLIFSLVLVSQGVIQNFSEYIPVEGYEKGAGQLLPMGPVASQIAIKQLGTNGGGYFGSNSAHPFENPTALSNFFEVIVLVLIPAATFYTYGLWVGKKMQGGILLLIMFTLWALGLILALSSEWHNNPLFNELPLMEGKEARGGVTDSILWAVTTTSTSNGSVNAMITSFTPLAGGVALLNMLLGEIIFGGSGVGLCSLIMFVLLTVFLSGLMVGRTPEYLGKKIELKEIQWVMLAILVPSCLALLGSALTLSLQTGLSAIGNQGPHGLTEVLYAFTSAAFNNGSSFASLNADTPYFNWMLGVVMILGRLAIILPSLAIGALLAEKTRTPQTIGNFSTDSYLFGILLFGVVLIVSALTFFPALTLGPIVESFLIDNSHSF